MVVEIEINCLKRYSLKYAIKKLACSEFKFAKLSIDSKTKKGHTAR